MYIYPIHLITIKTNHQEHSIIAHFMCECIVFAYFTCNLTPEFATGSEIVMSYHIQEELRIEIDE